MKERAGRFIAIDLLRGVVMALMALDHTRDFWFAGGDPTDLKTTTPALFFTRFVTHFCAPVFMFTAGMGAALSRRVPRELARFLVLRGLVLVLLEVTLNGWSWRFRITPTPQVLQVIWALGACMILLAPLVLLPRWVALAFGLVLCLGHNALDGWHPGGFAWSLLHERGRYALGHADWKLIVAYPLIPWAGVMALGWAAGPLVESPRRRTILACLGALLTIAFIVGRALGVYGDARVFVTQDTPVHSLLAFLNVTKYPPSLLYLCVTLGPALLFLAAADRSDGNSLAARVLLIFGRTPLFFYILHVPLIHGAALLAHTLGLIPEAGLALAGNYAVWLAALALLYPACRWYDALKQRRPDLTLLRYV